jgi:hypothetical protein
MKRFSINLATKPFRNNAILWASMGICIVALCVFSWWNVRAFRTVDESLAHWSEALSKRQDDMNRLAVDVASMNAEVGRFDLERLGERSEFANGIIMSRLLSWSTLFDRLEVVQPENVRLRSISPTVSSTGIDIAVNGISKDHESLLSFEEALLDSKYFKLVYPLQESSERNQSEINFNLLFGYLPQGFEEEAAPDPGREDVVDLADIPEQPEQDEEDLGVPTEEEIGEDSP